LFLHKGADFIRRRFHPQVLLLLPGSLLAQVRCERHQHQQQDALHQQQANQQAEQDRLQAALFYGRVSRLSHLGS